MTDTVVQVIETEFVVQVVVGEVLVTGVGGGTGGPVDWDDVQNKPATFAPSAHTHDIADVTGLQEALDLKQDILNSTDDLGEGSSNLYFTEARVRDTDLAGLARVFDLRTIQDSDTVLTALEVANEHFIALRPIAYSGLWNDLIGVPGEFPPAEHTHVVADVAGLQAALDGKQPSLGFTPQDAAQKGVAGGYAALDGTGRVPSSQLPSFVDDVLEFASLAAFPGTGEAGKMYVALDTGRIYRWSGSAYVEISASPGSTDAVVEGATNLYFTGARAVGAALTGYAIAGAWSAITATDTVLQAFGKIARRLADLSGLAFSGNASDLAGTKTSAFISDFASAVAGLITGKQDTLVSGANIKTVNGTSLLGAGNLVVGGGALPQVHEATIDFGSPSVGGRTFVVPHLGVTPASRISLWQAGVAAPGRDVDENEMDQIHFVAVAQADQITVYATCLSGTVTGEYVVHYEIGQAA